MIFDSENCVEEFEAEHRSPSLLPLIAFIKIEGRWDWVTVEPTIRGHVQFWRDDDVYINSAIQAIHPLFPPSDNEASEWFTADWIDTENSAESVKYKTRTAEEAERIGEALSFVEDTKRACSKRPREK